MLSIITVPLAGAVQVHQTDLSTGEKSPWSGSPGSLVAPRLTPVTVLVIPMITDPLANESFGGGGNARRFTTTVPLTEPHPSTAIWYVAPATLVKLTPPAVLPKPEATGMRSDTESPV